MPTALARTGTVNVNGTELYYEIRGDGPSLVLIAGGANDACVFETLAGLLADTYTVVSYDRRGLSRSPRPEGWTATSMEEQADDCAALIEALGVDRPVVFGHSLGGTIVVSLLERHPGSVRGAVVHEPGLSPIAPSFPKFVEELGPILTEATAGGPEVLQKALARLILGDEGYEQFDPNLLSRMAANAKVNELEITAEGAFRPNAEALAAAGVPVHAIHGHDTTHRWLVESAQWVSKASGGGPLHVFPGAHGAWLGREEDFAGRLRGILASMS